MTQNAPLPASVVESRFSPIAFVALCASFITIGGSTSLFGPLLNAIAVRFHQSLPSAGTVLSIYFVGGFVGVLLGWRMVVRYPGRVAVIGGLLAMTLGSGAIALAAQASAWVLFLAGAALMGAGFGTLDFALNTILARTAEEGRAHRLSFANAFWGVGSIVGPLAIILLRPKNFPVLFAMVAVITLLLSPLYRGLHAPALRHEKVATDPAVRRAQRPVLVTFIAAYVLYVGLETTASGWMASHLHGIGYSQSVGSFTTAGFWIGLTIARAFGGPLHRFFSAQQFVLGGLALAAVLGVAANSHTLAPVAYPLLGVCLANVYVFGIIWYQSVAGTDNRGIAIIIVFTMIGGVVGPGITSGLVSLSSVRVVPWSIAAQALLTLAVFVSSRRFRAADYIAQSNS